jgi:SecD/SecF fusion protein
MSSSGVQEGPGVPEPHHPGAAPVPAHRAGHHPDHRRAVIRLTIVVGVLLTGVVAVAGAVLLPRGGSESASDQPKHMGVVLVPVEPADAAILDQAVEALEGRASGLSTGASVSRDGDTLVARLPGFSDRELATAVLTHRGDLRFRSVLEQQWVPEADLAEQEVTSPEDDDPDEVVVLVDVHETTDPDGPAAGRFVYRLGPVLATGEIIDRAEAVLDLGMWSVDLTLHDGPEGLDRFNEVAALCYQHLPECPTGQLAIVLSSQVQSAPAVNQPVFERESVTITGAFDQRAAEQLAAVLSGDALPVALEVQP